jgi:hypothetical protein
MNTEYKEFHEKLANRQLAATVGAAVVNSAFQAAQLKQAAAFQAAQLEQTAANHREMLESYEERNRKVDYLNTLSPEGKVAYGQLKNKAGWDRIEIEYFFALTSEEDSGLYFEQRKIGWAHWEAAHFVELSPTDRRA